MRQLKSASFEFYEPDQIEQATVVEQLVSLTRSAEVKAGGEAWTCAWAPDNSYFAWSSGHHILHLIPWDCEKGKRHSPSDNEGLKNRRFHIIDCGENIWSVAFGSGVSHRETSCSFYRHCHFDENLIVATGLANGRINLWNCFTGALIIDLLDHRDAVRCLDFTKDGTLQLLSASHDGSLKLWDLPNEGNLYTTFKSPTCKSVCGCCFSPNAHFIAAVGSCKMVYLWTNAKMNSQPHKLDGHHNEVVSCDFSPDSALLITAAFDTKVIVWDTYTLQKIWAFGHMHPSPRLIFAGGANDHYVRSVTFCKNGLIVASVCDDGYVRFWNIADLGDPVAIARVDEPLSCQFSPNGSVLAVGLRSGDVMFLSASQTAPSLLQLSRQVIRKQTSSGHVTSLPIPKMLIGYVNYCDLLQQRLT
ncbi:hypothetical protein BsWGS_15518 [Bradybaena similaris]